MKEISTYIVESRARIKLANEQIVKFDKTNLNYSVPPFVTLYPQLIDL